MCPAWSPRSAAGSGARMPLRSGTRWMKVSSRLACRDRRRTQSAQRSPAIGRRADLRTAGHSSPTRTRVCWVGYEYRSIRNPEPWDYETPEDPLRGHRAAVAANAETLVDPPTQNCRGITQGHRRLKRSLEPLYRRGLNINPGERVPLERNQEDESLTRCRPCRPTNTAFAKALPNRHVQRRHRDENHDVSTIRRARVVWMSNPIGKRDFGWLGLWCLSHHACHSDNGSVRRRFGQQRPPTERLARNSSAVAGK